MDSFAPLPHSLVETVAGIAQCDGDFPTRIRGLSIHRRSMVGAPMPCLYGLGLGLTLQGRKRVLLGDEVHDFCPGMSLLTTVDLAVASQVVTASRAAPFLGMLLTLDPQTVIEEATKLDLGPVTKGHLYAPVSLEPLEPSLVDALTRMVRLLSEDRATDSLAPLIHREITIRLLLSSHGPHLRHVVIAGTPGQQIARVMSWLKLNFHRSLRMDELAESANMSPSTFRQHFREVAGMSPLQYQKQLRLQEARQLMLNEQIEASMAGLRVGYESASQFSREYSRLFGAPPQQDIRRMRLPVSGSVQEE
ncbi:AraC family transcriptional regulator [Pseudomonas syringae group genomosp. 3]|uniref:AraC family transcriptional regulator n=1 Tax=Pseudomonas syringae pv. viburni TaxID=251703 RepID=A0A0Q0CR41_9PSED|nr:AraC family transcriptional regulator [Pseudomonas syringae group genomosp. 3]KPZ08386.1 AraC family transcriptional regulator [Pseudomonas syringae pv. viburni]